MPKFYFHIANTDDFIPDLDGLNLQSLSACHDHGLRIIRECLPYVRNDLRRWWVEVADSTDNVVLTVLYPCRAPFGSLDGDPLTDARYWADFLKNSVRSVGATA